jgi:hypothetical protein
MRVFATMRVPHGLKNESGTIRRRIAYSLAAGAATAAVGGSDAEAIVFWSGPQDIEIEQFSSQTLFLDYDEYTDIVLKNYIFTNGNYQGATVSFSPGKIAGFLQNGLYYVSALEAGDVIDAAAMGPKFYGSMAYGQTNPNAEFNDVADAYIGLSFPIGGDTDEFIHYGWVRVSIDNEAGTFIVHDWAYEDVVGAAILAGDNGEEGLDGDFNDDGSVDAADYVVWRKDDGTPQGYDEWRANFGMPVIIGSGGGSGRAAATPEPMTLGLLAAGSLGVTFLRRSRRGTS